MNSSYDTGTYREKRPEDFEFPPLNEVPLIEKISQPGYKAPTQSKSSDQSTQEEQAFKVPTHIPDEVRSEYNKKVQSYDEPQQEHQEEQEVVQEEEIFETQEQEEVEQVESVPARSQSEENKKRNQQSFKESFQALRLKAEEAEREKDRFAKEAREKDAMIQRMLEMQMQNMGKQQQQQQEPDFNSIMNSVDNDGLVAGNQFKMAAQENKRYTDKVARDLEDARREMREMVAENRIRAKYPDLSRVLSNENFLILEQRAPANFSRLKSMPDSWDKVELMYEAIKSYGIDKMDDYKVEQTRIKSNMQKPRAVNSVINTKKESALANVNSFVDEYSVSEEQRRQDYRDMMNAISKG